MTQEETFDLIKEDIERKGIYYGEIVLSLNFHDGRISTYTITTTERRNCEKNSTQKIHIEKYGKRGIPER